MSQLDRIYRIDQLLTDRRSATFDYLMGQLEVSRATLKRDLAYLRDRLHAPIIYDRELQAYRFSAEERQAGAQYELPGLWFTAEEIHALLTMQHLLANLGPGGLLRGQIEPLIARLNGLLGSADSTADEIRRRILIAGMGKREYKLEHFERIGSALLRRKRVVIDYFSRGRNERATRTVSPQRLVHYRENWYLDAWCHLRNELRNFSVDAILRVESTNEVAREVTNRTLSAVLGPGYGIFSGQGLEWAQLRFTAERARWVAAEQWHPRQRGRYEADGSYLLEVPYSDPRELTMDILRFGADVEVLAPQSLRERVVGEIGKLARRYTLS